MNPYATFYGRQQPDFYAGLHEYQQQGLNPLAQRWLAKQSAEAQREYLAAVQIETTIYDYGGSIIEWPSGYWRSKVAYGPPVQPEYVPEWPFEAWGALGQEREEGDLC